MPVALVTGASQGFGHALTDALTRRGWSVVADGRRAHELRTATASMNAVIAVPGDVVDPGHRADLAATVRRLGRLDLLVNNASRLGPSPRPLLADYPADELDDVFATNVLAPLALIRLTLPLLSATGTIVNVSSDAAVEAYPGWGGYGASKAALDHATAVLGAELEETRPSLRAYAFDPGDMRTQMHQDAFPGEDISDRPEPATVVPALLRLIGERPPSGRYRVADLAAVGAGR